ncbi:hypothetical protein BLNAU_5153 [Blattamonas nauphoetae]|uniref:Uncharacterized protein n=1 Tax=Blattamonas nauphoetae TaxID=2049346 RepID=A0ABQ9Y887_9EUKA|nr:hypothetical protein BLNAU_5153 [Blattamonas nauphoetae]
MGSVLEWLSDSSIHLKNKVNSLQWFHIPTLLKTHIQSKKQQQTNEVLSQLLQRMMTILDECFDSHTPITNKRLLHSSLSQLAQSPSLTPSIQRDLEKCIVSLKSVDEDLVVHVERHTLESIDNLLRDCAQLRAQHDLQETTLHQTERRIGQLEKEKADFLEKEKSYLWMIMHLQKEKEQIQRENERLRGESEKRVTDMQRTMEGMKVQLDSHIGRIGAKECIVAFSPIHFCVSGSTETRIHSASWAGCFTKIVTKGIHRLSIKTEATSGVMIGVLDAAEYPKHLSSAVYTSPTAAMMYNANGFLMSAGNHTVQNNSPQKLEEWSAEADLEKKTLHFFIDGVQQQHHFINIPVPLVFAIGSFKMNVPIEITFWGEVMQSHVTFEGTGHDLG